MRILQHAKGDGSSGIRPPCRYFGRARCPRSLSTLSSLVPSFARFSRLDRLDYTDVSLACAARGSAFTAQAIGSLIYHLAALCYEALGEGIVLSGRVSLCWRTYFATSRGRANQHVLR